MASPWPVSSLSKPGSAAGLQLQQQSRLHSATARAPGDKGLQREQYTADAKKRGTWRHSRGTEAGAAHGNFKYFHFGVCVGRHTASGERFCHSVIMSRPPRGRGGGFRGRGPPGRGGGGFGGRGRGRGGYDEGPPSEVVGELHFIKGDSPEACFSLLLARLIMAVFWRLRLRLVVAESL